MLAALAIAQTTTDQAEVVILPSVGGSTNPLPGNYTYANGTAIVLSAVASTGYEFKYWIVSGSYTPGHTGGNPGYFVDPDTGQVVQLPVPPTLTGINALVFTANPANITCGYGYTFTYQAIFAPTSGTPTATPPPQTLPATNNTQVVTILPSVGGTTDPAPGTYVYDTNHTFTLSATPSAGFTFHFFTVAGTYTPGHLAEPQYVAGVTDQFPTVPSSVYLPTQDSLVFATNPATITCGYGYSYTYQAVFDPVNATVPPIPTTTPPPSSTPAVTVTPTPTPSAQVTETPTPTPAPSGTNYTLPIIAVIVVIIIIIIVIAAVMMRRKK